MRLNLRFVYCNRKPKGLIDLSDRILRLFSHFDIVVGSMPRRIFHILPPNSFFFFFFSGEEPPVLFAVYVTLVLYNIIGSLKLLDICYVIRRA